MTDILLETRNKTVATLHLNRPAARNALSLEMIATIHQSIRRLGEDPAIHVIILAANGPAFSGGHDLKEITAARQSGDKGRAFFEETMRACADLMLAIVHCPKPIIAQVQGVATAAGCQLVASCDLAVASRDAVFATPGVNIGLFCSTPMVALSRNVSRKAAMEMLLTGDMVSADQAQSLGLVNRVVGADTLEAETAALAHQIAAKSPKTLRIGKAAFYAQAEMRLADAYDYAARVMVENLMTRDANEGIGAFVEKRTPEWEGLDAPEATE
ncbi:MAG: enoyl-CoA hydratase [Paracoccaceae bacterium]|nr:enoyl-CoA hydratase [Paracoccaceae bacterium]